MKKKVVVTQQQKLVGRVFCFTGVLVGMTRKEAEEKVKQLGAKVAKSITKKVTDVVVGRGGGSKRAEAEKLGVKIIDQAEFEALLGAKPSATERPKQSNQEVIDFFIDVFKEAQLRAITNADADEDEDGDHDSAWDDDEPSADVVPMRSDDFWSAFEARGEKDPVTGMPREVVDRLTGAVLVLIPAGEFVMGSPASEADRSGDEGQHRRVIRKPFYLGKTAVTQAQWRKVMGSNPSSFKGDDLPVDSVSWYACQEFLKKAGGGMRLPSEAEWEYACRAGTTTPFSFGATITPEQVNYDGYFPYGGASEGLCRDRTVAVGSLPANAWGLHEMHGNVDEWCQDGYEAYPGSGTEEPARAAGARVLRGGSWNDRAYICRAAGRGRNEPGWDGNIGLRLARTLPE